MTVFTALLISVILASAIYLILQFSLMKTLFGFGLLNHAVDLFVLVVSKSPENKTAPIIKMQNALYVDPTPQALILTAIVIGFGVTAYLVVLLYKIYNKNKSIDLKEIFNEN